MYVEHVKRYLGNGRKKQKTLIIWIFKQIMEQSHIHDNYDFVKNQRKGKGV